MMVLANGFLMAAGLEQLRLTPQELDWLWRSGRFRRAFVDYLERLRCAGDVHAMAEGTIFFPHEPILRVTAPTPQAQLVETRLINRLRFQTVIASRAARTVLGGLLYGVPVYGTMAHSSVQAHDEEAEAFERFAHAPPDNVVLLLETYATEAAAEKVVALATPLRQRGITVKAVRLDSGDLADLARKVRRILDAGGLQHGRILACGNLDEEAGRTMVSSDTPIDDFAVSTRLDTSADAPYSEGNR